ncbi:MAG: hypothetical protein AB8G22_14190 [Saprospiraceae bacterium]
MRIILFLLLFSECLSAQTDSLNFPASWSGKWQGTLEIFSEKGKQQELPMQLHILPMDTSDRYTWTIIYGEDEKTGTRPYELVTIDAEKGLYAIDEKNSIQMEAFLLGGKLFQRFEVMGSLLLTTNELHADGTLSWEIISGKLEPVSVTGDQKVAGEDIPPVQAFPIGVLQRAVMKKME